MITYCNKLFYVGILLQDDDDTVHDYFNQSVRQRAVGKTTSDHTLAKLGASMLNEEQIAAILKSQRDTHAGHREKILKTLSRNFSFWSVRQLQLQPKSELCERIVTRYYTKIIKPIFCTKLTTFISLKTKIG